MRKKTKPTGGNAFYQLVESRRVGGLPRQRVVMHLGSHATVDEAIEGWPREITGLRRGGHTEAADALGAKLDRLKALKAGGVVPTKTGVDSQKALP